VTYNPNTRYRANTWLRTWPFTLLWWMQALVCLRRAWL